MSFTPEEKADIYSAEQWAKKKENIAHVFRDITAGRAYRLDEQPAAIFMAGSPGAGKTEVSKNLLAQFAEPPIRIDADEFRTYMPGYTGTNSYIYQSASTIMVQKILDRLFKGAKQGNRAPFLLDSTFSYYKIMDNLGRTAKYGYAIDIYYVYQEPELAWEFTQAREQDEGRTVPLEAFARAFIQAREHVVESKQQFGDQVQVSVIVKDLNAKDSAVYIDVEPADIDKILPKRYNEDELIRMLAI